MNECKYLNAECVYSIDQHFKNVIAKLRHVREILLHTQNEREMLMEMLLWEKLLRKCCKEEEELLDVACTCGQRIEFPVPSVHC